MNSRFRSGCTLAFFTVLALTAVAVACGGGGSDPFVPPPATGGGGSTSSVTAFTFIGDAPPPGSTILTFEITLDSATLCPEVGAAGECQGTPQVSLLSEPVEIELEQLELESAFLNLADVPVGTYDGVQLTFSNPELKLLLEDGTVQELEAPTLPVNPSTVTPTFDGGLEVTADIDFGFLVDFNIFDSIQTDSAGNVTEISPMVTLVKLPALAGEEIEELEDVNGEVTNLNKTCPTGTFTLVPSGSGIPIENINFDETTEFEGEDDVVFDCLSLENGQIVEADLRLVAAENAQSSEFFAEEIELDDLADEEELEGVVFQVNSSTQFVLLVQEEEGVPSVAVGSFVTIDLMESTEFEIDDADELTIPEGLSFIDGGDLLAGQSVEVELAQDSLVIPEGATCSTVEDGCTATADELELEEGTLTARVASTSDPNFTLDDLPSLFGSDPDNLRPISADCQSCFVGSILVSTSGQTEFRDDLTGVGDLNPEDVVTVRGLLFKNSFGPPQPGEGSPQLVAERVRRQD